MSGHLDGPPPGPPDPPYIPGDLGAPSAEEFARRRASPTPEEWNPYAPSADWKPGQDTFTSQAAGIWAEGFAAGRAAATPDPPAEDAVTAIVRVLNRTMDLPARERAIAVLTAMPAASPDERLREALREIVDTAPGIDRWTIDRRLDDEQWTGKVAVEVVRASSVDVMVAALRAALAAADRPTPPADERLREALAFYADEEFVGRTQLVTLAQNLLEPLHGVYERRT